MPLPPRDPAPAHADSERGGDLSVRYAALTAKYRELVEKYRSDTARTSSATVLALAAMRASATALAALREGRFVVRNERWLELACGRGAPWRGEDGERHATLEAAALREACALEAADAGGSRTLRYERDGCDDVAEVHLEQVRASSPALVLAMITDVTDRVRGERELARAHAAMEAQERLRAVGELASGLAHDLNNTLHALGLRLSRLAACTGGCAEHQDDLRAAARIAADAGARVRRLQDFAHRREDVPDERVDLAAVARHAVEVADPELRRPGTSVRVKVEVPALPPVVGSPAELGQILVGLLLNARDAMPRGGCVVIDGHATDDGGAALVVTDEGRGIPADNLERIFDPFFTTKGRRGTGLGLSIAAGVMRRLGGGIRAENVPGGGARFVLRFPPAAGAVTPALPPARGVEAAAVAAPRGGAGAARRVLVVDDDPDNLDAMRLVLAERGHHVEVTQSGLDAAGRVEAGERYDIVLCDLGLGDTTGWEVAERISGAAPGTPVVLVTGWAEEIPRDDPRRRHVSRVLAKPLGLDDLRTLLDGGGEPRADGPRPGGERPDRPGAADAQPAASP